MSELKSFFDWYRERISSEKPWLVLGKGPSYQKITDHDLTGFYLVSLNHVVEKVRVTAAHVIDLDVVLACQESIDRNAEVLVMPWVPHVDNKPGTQNLSDLIGSNSFFAHMSEQGRLLYYHHLPKRKFGDDPLVEVAYFSSEAAIDLLAKAGVKSIKTLGIDGGNSYSDSFSHLSDTTLLSNGRKSFNKQFSQLAKTIMKTGVELAPLDIDSPIRIYVATTEAQMLAVKVLEYSIKKHASMSVEVFPLHLSNIEIPKPREQHNWPRTPFSFQRLLIPEIAGYEGKAIYLDSDMQVFKDIKDLWTLPFNGGKVLAVQKQKATGRRPQFSVMVLDCGHLDWDIKEIVKQLDSGELTYESLMYELSIASPIKADIDSVWNSLERFEHGETALLHYTDMSTQPWVSTKNPHGYLWFRDLFEAIDEGFISLAYVKDHIEKGFVRPSLLFQIEHKIDDAFLLPKSARKLDINFNAAYTAIHSHGGKPWVTFAGYLKAIVRKMILVSGLTTLSRRIKAHLDRD
jgi:hypothetical protein